MGEVIPETEEVVKYTITNNLSNCVNNNTSTSINRGSSYEAIITIGGGYELKNIEITMGGTDVTTNVYIYQDGKAIVNISEVTGDIVIIAQATAISEEEHPGEAFYTVTKNLTNCSSSNTSSSATEGTSYTTSITADSGYTLGSITVTMNGNDITSTAVNGNSINISNVTGDLVITAIGNPRIYLSRISDMTVYKGQTFNILYSSNISAVKHEISWDGGNTFYDKTSEITVSNTVNYKYSHNAETEYDSFSMAIRVTDANGNTDVKYFAITFENNATEEPENPPIESGDLLDSTGAYVIDDFSGSSVDRNKWDYELGYVRNSELQNYTSTNTEVSNSILALKGIKDSNGNWTSASIISKGHFAFMYGKIECRAKIDPTWGSFSAFWTLGDSFEFGYHDGAAPDTLGEWWAYCGEFDVMEFYSGNLTCGIFFNEREESGRVWYNNYDFNAWHTFAMEWLEDGTLIFSIDGNELSRTSATDNRAFHIPHFILINQAIGASGGTPADSTTAITQYVDWVKYYPVSTSNLVLNSSDFSLQVTDHNDSAHNCVVRPIFNDNCINKSLTWSSSDSSLVWVYSGLCGTYAGANGTVTITATSHSGVSKSITLTVTDGTIR